MKEKEMNDWIHTRRGVRLVEGTLPQLAEALKALTVELKRLNDRADSDDLPREGEDCNEYCAIHDSECDGHCDHHSDHTNGCQCGGGIYEGVK
jgi:hypothetical protein